MSECLEIIAIPVWGKRISPVFDAATSLLIIELAEEGPRYRHYLDFSQGSAEEVLVIMKRYGAKLLICGAISTEPAALLEAGGVELLPFITGKVRQVAESLWNNEPVDRRTMPGCERTRSRKHGCIGCSRYSRWKNRRRD